MDEIEMHYTYDDFFNSPFESLSKKARTTNEIKKLKVFELKDEILYYNSRVCVPKFGEHRLNIMNNLQDIPKAVHLGFQKTYRVVKRHYYWPGAKKIKKYIEICLKCQISKTVQVKYFGLQQPLDVPNLKFESNSMDIIVGLPKI
jgi:hypothetical protein